MKDLLHTQRALCMLRFEHRYYRQKRLNTSINTDASNASTHIHRHAYTHISWMYAIMHTCLMSMLMHANVDLHRNMCERSHEWMHELEITPNLNQNIPEITLILLRLMKKSLMAQAHSQASKSTFRRVATNTIDLNYDAKSKHKTWSIKFANKKLRQ